MNTKKILSISFITLFCVQFVYAQASAPMWINEKWRDTNHPSALWYTGFSEDRLGRNDNLAQSLERLERNAQNKMAEAITVRISSSSTLETASQQRQQGRRVDETIDQRYLQSIQASTSSEIAKAEVRSYHDPKTNRIYAFSAVKKEDLANFYRSKIATLFSFANREFVLAEQLAGQDNRRQALDKISAIEDSMKRVVYWGSALQIVVSDNSYVEEELKIWQKVSNMKSQLESGNTLYLDVSGEVDYSRLAAEIQGQESKFRIVRDKSAASFVITIGTRIGSCTQNTNRFMFCNASATVTVNNQRSGRIINVRIPEAKGGWGNNNREKAAEQAFNDLIKNIAKQVVQTINDL